LASLTASESSPAESGNGPEDDILPGMTSKPLFDFDFPYKDLLPKVTAYCYKALVANPSCCLDERFALGVARHTLRRQGTSWACTDATHCQDLVRGYRGDDAIWVPDDAKCSAPRILYIHGGSWMYGSPDSMAYGQLASKLSALSGAVVMLPDIPLLPIANYSGQITASLRALQFLASSDPPGCLGSGGHEAPIFIGGDSAGAGTALSLMLELNMNPKLLPKGKRLAGGFFYSPWTNLMCNTPDYYDHAFAKIVDTESFKHKNNNKNNNNNNNSNIKGKGVQGRSDESIYVGDIMFRGKPNSNAGGFQLNSKAYVGGHKRLLTDPVASPMYAQRTQIVGAAGGGGLPPLYFATGSSESILGDSVIFAQKAAAFGVKIRMDIFEGMWHVFPTYSEGCGEGEALLPGVIALNRTAQHVRHLAQFGTPFFGTAPGIPHTHLEYDHGLASREKWWAPEGAAAESEEAEGLSHALLAEENSSNNNRNNNNNKNDNNNYDNYQVDSSQSAAAAAAVFAADAQLDNKVADRFQLLAAALLGGVVTLLLQAVLPSLSWAFSSCRPGQRPCQAVGDPSPLLSGSAGGVANDASTLP
ncbi:unnamed protein product, partial [Polarella glacialis]